jgi:hypothetical protein
MEQTAVATVTDADWKAEIFSTAVPGEFRVVYQDAEGHVVEEARLTGISSYHQREGEILDHLRKLRSGELTPQKTPDLSDPGEY